MRPLKLVLIPCIFLLFINAVLAQSRLSGKVVEVIDGKTVVIELQTGNRVTTELQSIETPLPEQPLYQTVKQHLKNLVLDKVVEFRANGMNGSKAIGKLYLGGTDVAMQLVRDGAAWYAANASIEASESETYQSNQLLAKLEKRGIWSVERMKPPKEFKAEIEAEKKEAAMIRAEVKKPVDESHSKTRLLGRAEMEATNASVQIWPEVAGSKSPSFDPSKQSQVPENVETGYSPEKGVGYVQTKMTPFILSSGDSSLKALFQMGYLYKMNGEKTDKSPYIIFVSTFSDKGGVLNSKTITVVADGKRIVLNRVELGTRSTAMGTIDGALYKVPDSAVAKFAKSKTLGLMVGKYTGKIGNETIAQIDSVRKY